MNILVITSLYPNPLEPGRGLENREQLQALSRRHAVRVISPVAWTTGMSEWRTPPCLPATRELVDGRIRVAYPRYWYTPKMLRSWYGQFFRRSAHRAFTQAVSDSKPDVVLGSWAYPDGWAAVALARQAGLPVMVKVHGCDVHNQGLGIAAFPGRYRGTVAALRGADGVIAVGKDLADAVVALGVDRNKVHVVRNGTDLVRFSPGDRDTARRYLGLDWDRPLLLFVGRLSPEKGLGYLLSACRLLRRSGLVFRCYLVGDGELRDQLTKQIIQMGLQGSVILVGAQYAERLPNWYRAADLIVLPSLSEGVPNVILQTLACNRPFVASRVGGVPEIAARPEYLVPPADPEALAAGIRASLERGASPEGREAVISWDESAASMSSVLKHAVVQRTNVSSADRARSSYVPTQPL